MFFASIYVFLLSHPVWVRGLKSIYCLLNRPRPAVAPRVGAWIEILFCRKQNLTKLTSHPVWVRGLKFGRRTRGGTGTQSHPVWVRGLKFLPPDKCYRRSLVAPRVGAWIEIYILSPIVIANSVAPRVGAWIEISKYTSVHFCISVAPRVGAWIEIHRIGFTHIT